MRLRSSVCLAALALAALSSSMLPLLCSGFVFVSRRRQCHHHARQEVKVKHPRTRTGTTTTSRFRFQMMMMMCSPPRNNNNNKNVSAADRERREEEKRRKQRQKDVVIGQTSAKPDAHDYQIDPVATEQAWMDQASDVEREVYLQTERGLEMMRSLRLMEADEAFHRVFELRPNAYVWQAGIVKYYLGEYEAAIHIFSASAKSFESRFSTVASEERIWKDACELKKKKNMKMSSLHKRRKNRKKEEEATKMKTTNKEQLIIMEASEPSTTTPDDEETAGRIYPETRRVFRLAAELFSNALANDPCALALSRGRLRSITIGGPEDGRTSTTPPDPKMWKLCSWYYLGLHYDALGNDVKGKHCMKMALRFAPSAGNANDLLQTLPLIHMSERDWFDDDSFDQENSEEKATNNNADRDVVQITISESISELRHADLRDALKARGLMSTGPKELLHDRLVDSLLEDIDLD